MLRITIPTGEMWDDDKQTFIDRPQLTLELEHSLLSISKWESRWTTPFLSKKELTADEAIDYVRCMTMTPDVPDYIYNLIPDSTLDEIAKYIEAPMTATWFNNTQNKPGKKEIITSELIYYWMIALNIPSDYDKWHLNRLLTLIRVCEIKSNPPKKMSKSAIMSRNRSLNAARRQQLNSKG